MEGIAASAISETSRLPLEVPEVVETSLAFKRLEDPEVPFEEVCVLLSINILTPWKVPAASPPKRTALRARALTFFRKAFCFLFRLD